MIVQRYPEPFIAPMRAELSRLGFEDLKTPDAVDAAVKQPGTTMIVVNSVCGCAAGKARPGIAHGARPRASVPITWRPCLPAPTSKPRETARDHFAPYPPSSPSIAIMKDGKVVYMMERRDIEGPLGRHDRGGAAEGVRDALLTKQSAVESRQLRVLS